MEITETKGSRFELALDLMRSGRTVTYRGVALSLDADGALRCCVQSSWRPENVTEDSVRQDLAGGRQVMADLASASTAFASLVLGRRCRAVLADDYGMGAVHLATEEDGVLHWASGFGPTRPR
jgi:hypothetical protein